MTDKLELLKSTLASMIEDDETIAFRSVVRRMTGIFNHATDITRNAERRAELEKAVQQQVKIRSAVTRKSKKSHTELERKIATKNIDVERLTREIDILVASHKTLILAVTQMGGFNTWCKFFADYEEATRLLIDLDALPAELMRPLPS